MTWTDPISPNLQSLRDYLAAQRVRRASDHEQIRRSLEATERSRRILTELSAMVASSPGSAAGLLPPRDGIQGDRAIPLPLDKGLLDDRQ